MRLSQRFQPIHCVIYTGDTCSAEEILETTKVRVVAGVGKTQKILHIDIRPSLHLEFVRLSKRGWLEAHHYPHFTMLFQSLASMALALEGLSQFVPDLFVDTTGLAFTYPVVKLFSSARVLSYTHYPAISCDMLRRVALREAQFNNDALIASHPLLSAAKQLCAPRAGLTRSYYRLFALLYALAGRCADLVLANGSWTYQHLRSLWRQPQSAFFFSPVSRRALHRVPALRHHGASAAGTAGAAAALRAEPRAVPPREGPREAAVHPAPPARSRCAVAVLSRADERFADVRLVMAGGCRNAADEARVRELQKIAEDIQLSRSVLFLVNVRPAARCSLGALRRAPAVARAGLRRTPHDARRAFRNQRRRVPRRFSFPLLSVGRRTHHRRARQRGAEAGHRGARVPAGGEEVPRG